MGFYGNTAEYLGSTVDAGEENPRVERFLLWQAMLAARARGAQTFDLGGGVDRQRMTPELYCVKAGCRGRAVSPGARDGGVRGRSAVSVDSLAGTAHRRRRSLACLRSGAEIGGLAL
ncbi:MAG: hypothetical protein FD149_1204 [Rhodospirillaceae bacterium]|nr:MAG: hypothetical protein FD149_1204 [Rhodospirillaceae bacterium]